jgi:mono/diheme cytochrome c family protein
MLQMTNSIMDRGLRLLGVTTFLIALGACGHSFEPPNRGERIARAEGVFSPTLFDSVTWESEAVRALEGNEVYAAKCRRCHGTLGAGATDYGSAQRLDVPSLVQAEWAYADDFESVRRRIFVGHEEGMPSGGLGLLTPREIDGVAYYVFAQLRADVLQQD